VTFEDAIAWMIIIVVANLIASGLDTWIRKNWEWLWG
jgi:hypothetical protein